ncbi:Arsenical-resistance protein Acr3 [Trichoderma lentiforme]|uniref:Arsenical-resistance protein Acr3 n=1 Tax=Trichoderma lentiforme TaxID=1567552 RepID=A0A9P4XPS8_9HYPO|nr:Arsenical-resistance protein Acr3 [Trichoderma lentiforme]
MSDHKAMEAQDASEPDLRQEKPSTDIEAQQTDSHDARHINDNNVQQKRSFSAFASLGLLDRFLAVWIFLAMAIGIILGNFVPSMSPALEKGKFVGVSVSHGELLLLFDNALQDTDSQKLAQLALSWAFLPDKSHLRTGLILVGLGRCIAMVLIWNALAGGNNDYCAILVAVNSILQIVLFAPLAIFFLNVISDENDIAPISYSVVATSVAAFLGIPLGAAVITRFGLRCIAGPAWYDRIFIRFVSPWSLIGLLYTILVLFAAQGHQVVHQIVSVLRVAAPLVVYFAIVFFTTVGICRMLGFEYQFLVTQSFTAASNNFELAIAVAVATFGPNSDEALASTVGPLIEVPVLLGLVYALRWVANRWGWK